MATESDSNPAPQRSASEASKVFRFIKWHLRITTCGGCIYILATLVAAFAVSFLSWLCGADRIQKVFTITTLPDSKLYTEYTETGGYIASANHALLFLLVAPAFIYLASRFITDINTSFKRLLMRKRICDRAEPQAISFEIRQRFLRFQAAFGPLFLLSAVAWISFSLTRQWDVRPPDGNAVAHYRKNLTHAAGFGQADCVPSWKQAFNKACENDKWNWMFGKAGRSIKVEEKLRELTTLAFLKGSVNSCCMVGLEKLIEPVSQTIDTEPDFARIVESGQYVLEIPAVKTKQPNAYAGVFNVSCTSIIPSKWDASNDLAFGMFWYLLVMMESTFHALAFWIVVYAVSWLLLLSLWIRRGTTTIPGWVRVVLGFVLLLFVIISLFASFMVGIAATILGFGLAFLIATLLQSEPRGSMRGTWVVVFIGCVNAVFSYFLHFLVKDTGIAQFIVCINIGMVLGVVTHAARINRLGTLRLTPNFEDPNKRYGFWELHAAYNTLVLLLAAGSLCASLLLLNEQDEVFAASIQSSALLIQGLTLALVFALIIAILLGPMMLFRALLSAPKRDHVNGLYRKLRQKKFTEDEFLKQLALVRQQSPWPRDDRLFVAACFAVLAFSFLPLISSVDLFPGSLKHYVSIPHQLRDAADILSEYLHNVAPNKP